MITKQEVMDLAWEFSLAAKTIEKDYILGWLLAGIAQHPQLADQWIFKGGTCLKKCYFETYRFSEDLDYTLLDKTHINAEFLTDSFKQIATWIYDQVGIEIPTHTIRFEVYENKAGKVSVEGRIGYIGPLQRRGDPARVKLDLTADEILVKLPLLREVHHPYSDKPLAGIKAYCYSFPEIFAEKMRALSERARPRDLYDVIHLYRHTHPATNLTLIVDILKTKCAYKGIPMPTLEQLENHPKLHELETEWANMLSHQLPMLPSREYFWQDLPRLFTWLQANDHNIMQEPVNITQELLDAHWQPPSMIQPWRVKVPLELVRYAAANHLCVMLSYDNKEQLIEPYDLKRIQDGGLLLIAVEHLTGEMRTYHVERITKIAVTQTAFVPRWLITLTPFLK